MSYMQFLSSNSTELIASDNCMDECFIDFYASKENCCDRKLIIVRIVATIVTALAAFAIPWKVVFLYKRLANPLGKVVNQRIQVAFGIFTLVHDISYLIHGILKMVGPTEFVLGNPNANVGIDVCFFFNSSCYVCMLHCLALNSSQFLNSSMKIIPPETREKVAHLTSKVDKRAYFAPIMGVLLSFLPFICYAERKDSDVYNSLYLFGYWCIMVYQTGLNFALSTFVLQEMRRAVDNSSSIAHDKETDDKIKASIAELSKSRRSGTFKNVIIITIWLFSVLSPDVRAGFTYFYMLFYMLSYSTTMMSIRGFWHFKKSSRVDPEEGTVKPVAKYAIVHKNDPTPSHIVDSSSPPTDRQATTPVVAGTADLEANKFINDEVIAIVATDDEKRFELSGEITL